MVDHATAGTMTSSPGTSGRGNAGLTSAAAATRLAEEPEFTMTASATPRYSAHISSKRRTLSPMVTRVVSRHSIASFHLVGAEGRHVQRQTHLARAGLGLGEVLLDQRADLRGQDRPGRAHRG